MHIRQADILNFLQGDREATIREVQDGLHARVDGLVIFCGEVRYHLNFMLDKGLLEEERKPNPNGKKRPVITYRLSDAGKAYRVTHIRSKNGSSMGRAKL